ncbi:putative DNA-binding transcriptional regulator YafY [Micromonospora sp. Llam0]|uniref:helix-turn-helix transcriptional regulator n=1 Tax=Micromonospora sp. Llam0 TaxID=2485143 RepID=UPI000F486903|nr:YafY family protein [Micromonospora sp. Llam0]ROO62476.1 putative DNA-binding transcriptional regulator YafY [Micromonospora sp. Llam0]
MRVARLISLVLLLQSRETMTAAELARELEVSERTIYRDVLALSAAGVPVYADQGRAGGYRLLDGYRTRLTGLSRAEAETLFLSGLPGPADEMGLADVLGVAQLKVTAALPVGLRDAAGRARQRFHLDAPGWFRQADPPPALAHLARATWQDQVVRLDYRRSGTEVARTVQPYGLVLKNGTWYLVGRVPDIGRGNDGHRIYRVDRIAAVEPAGDVFDRDRRFDLAEVWAAGTADFVRSILVDEVTVRLSPAGLRALRWAVEAPAAQAAREAAGPPDGQGWVHTRLPVESPDVAYSQLQALGPEVEVLAPAVLRDRMCDAARRLAALYGDAVSQR